MHKQVAAVAPLATATELTSIRNTCVTGIGGRTKYSLVATTSYVPLHNSGLSYASRLLPSAPM